MRRRRLIGVYRGLLKSIEVPWLQCGIEVRGGETGRRNTPQNGIGRLSVHTQNLTDRLGQYNRHKPTSFRAQRQLSAAVDCLDRLDPLCKARRIPSLLKGSAR